MNNRELINFLKHYSKIEFIHKVSLVTSYLEEVANNSIFICFNNEDIKFAIEKGAKTIIYTGKINKDSPIINYILVDDIKKAKAILYKAYYKNVSSKIKIIGVIGTTGKSTTSKLICDFLNFEGKKSLWIGTHEIRYQDEIYKTNNTTMDISMLYKHLLLCKKRRYKYVVMEVSSIGISELRIYGIDFYRLIFTNFSEDHLDYHKTMDNYFYTKAIPFYQSKNIIILNKDDPMFYLINKYTNTKYISYSINKTADLVALDILHNNDKLCFRIKDVSFSTNFYGHFFVYDILAAIATLASLKYTFLEIKDFLSTYQPMLGRMSKFSVGTNKIIVDYAHTPKSLEVVLQFLRKFTSNNLIVVGGCGGNREKEKRALMGDIIDLYSDYAILTDDNPRDEEPLKIIEEIKQCHSFEILPNRKEAIIRGYEMLNDYDTLLIFGKGNEEGIIYKDKIVEHNDFVTLSSLLKER